MGSRRTTALAAAGRAEAGGAEQEVVVAGLALVAAFALVALDPHQSLAAAPCAALPSVSRVASLDEASRTTQSFEAERDLREFALYAYRNVAGDIVNGRGPYLDALAEPFRASCADSVVLLDWLRGMLAGAGSATEFSRRMAVALAAVRGASEQHPTR